MIKFSKYNGLGNDFIITDETVSSSDVKKLCDRHFGIGADGLIINKKRNGLPFMSFFNADGSVAKMCGNGIRCFAKYLELKNEDYSQIDTLSGIKQVEKIDDKYKVCLGKAQINFLDKEIELKNKKIKLNFIDTGTDHCCIIDKEIDFEFLEKYGKLIEKNYDIFPNGTNVNVAHILSENEMNVYTWERGVGITLACGTGAGACVYVANLKGYVKNTCIVNLLGGFVEIKIVDNDVYMTGTATKVFEGEIDCEMIK